MKKSQMLPLSILPRMLEGFVVVLIVVFVLIVAYSKFVEWTGSQDYLREATERLNDQPPEHPQQSRKGR